MTQQKNIYGRNPDNVLVIGDLHLPFTVDGYLEFCLETQAKYDCGTVIFSGDLADFHYSSFHQTEPDADGCTTEYHRMLQKLKPWQLAFPKATITYGNHDLIPLRKGFAGGLSAGMIKPWNQLFDAPKGWKFVDKIVLDNVLYIHGTNPALRRMVQSRISVVQGHLHSEQYVQWSQSEVDRLFAMQVGCGIDDQTYAFAYGRSFAKRPILGCAVVLDKGTTPIVVPMHINTSSIKVKKAKKH